VRTDEVSSSSCLPHGAPPKINDGHTLNFRKEDYSFLTGKKKKEVLDFSTKRAIFKGEKAKFLYAIVLQRTPRAYQSTTNVCSRSRNAKYFHVKKVNTSV
jgi:hypothetical protein